MKSNRVFFLICLACASSLVFAQTFSFKRYYKVGHSVIRTIVAYGFDSHGNKVKDPMEKTRIITTILKVDKNGSADVMLSQPDTKMDEDNATMGHMDSNGVYTQLSTDSSIVQRIYATIVQTISGSISLGQKKNLAAHKNSKDGHIIPASTVTLESDKGDVATLTFNACTYANFSGMCTIHGTGTMKVDTKSKLILSWTINTDIKGDPEAKMGKHHAKMLIQVSEKRY